MRIIFMGTPEFSVLPLQTLLQEKYDVIAVVSQPDRPKGRKRVLTPPPVKIEAEKHGIPVFQPEKLRDPAAVEEIKALQPDLIVTAAYGQILPKSILTLPPFGCINIHASLLPKYRGGAPIQHAIINGESITGVTMMYMAEGLDTGDMISRVEVPISNEATAGTLFAQLSVAGAELLKETLPELLTGNIQTVTQNHEEATYAPNISRDDERIDWSRTSVEIHNQVRGLNPFPSAFTLLEGTALKVKSCVIGPPTSSNERDISPGTILNHTVDGIEVKTLDGSLVLTEFQLAGKKAMDAAQFHSGNKIQPGTILDSSMS